MKFDIEALEAARGNTFDLVVGTTDGEQPVGFRLVGQASEQYQAVRREIEAMDVRDYSARRELAVDPQAIADGAAKRRDMLVKACVVDFFGFSIAGAKAEFTAENLERVLKAMPQWLERIAIEIEREGNFIGG